MKRTLTIDDRHIARDILFHVLKAHVPHVWQKGVAVIIKLQCYSVTLNVRIHTGVIIVGCTNVIRGVCERDELTNSRNWSRK
jgi:hypothetical protein